MDAEEKSSQPGDAAPQTASIARPRRFIMIGLVAAAAAIAIKIVADRLRSHLDPFHERIAQMERTVSPTLQSSDKPVENLARLRELVSIELPAGYECSQAVLMEGDVRLFLINRVGPATADAPSGFIVMSTPGEDEHLAPEMFDAILSHRDPLPDGQAAPRSTVRVKLGTNDTEAIKIVGTSEGKAFVEHYVPVAPGLSLYAFGPSRSFDQGAFDSLLRSIGPAKAAPDTSQATSQD